jgi:hypothetical protein
MRAKRALKAMRAPDERGAERRAWAVARSAYLERAPSSRPRTHRRVGLALALAALVGAAALSPAGATVGRLITRALGVEHAATRLFAPPAGGQLLISGPGGSWTVAGDGSTRRLGPWPQASWSPHGLFVAAAGRHELIAVDPHGRTQWTLSRPAVSDPRWFSPTGYRIAYLSGDALRVVAGDGTGDHLLAAGVAKVAPAWRAGHPYELAYATRQGRLIVRDGDTGRTVWSADFGSTPPRQLIWSSDGRQLLAFSPTEALVYAGGGGLTRAFGLAGDGPATDVALSPDGRTLALVHGGGDVVVENVSAATPTPRRVLSGSGLRGLLWSPDGRWLLVGWPAANQWVFVRAKGAPRIAAVSRIAQKFPGGAASGFPTLDGWCCNSAQAAP